MRNDLCKQLREHLQPFLRSGRTYCVGLSGGSDSIVLLHVLREISRSLDFRLVALHVNHCLRGKESDGDATFCEKTCEKLGVEILVHTVDVNEYARRHRLSVEDAARRCRFRWFAAVAKELNASCLFLAHHADDQAETVLLRLFRGAGLRGLGGIRPVTTFRGLKIVRPWLDVRRDVLAAWREARGLPCRTDSSNTSTHIDRNWIRHVVLPQLNKRFPPDITERLIRTADVSRTADEYLAVKAAGLFETHGRRSVLGVLFPLDEFRCLHPALQRGVVCLMLDCEHDLSREAGFDAIEAVRNYALGRAKACPRQLPRSVRAGKAYGHLFVGRKPSLEITPATVAVKRPLSTPSGLTVTIERVDERGAGISDNGEAWREVALGNETEMVQYAALPARAKLAVRTRRAGDRYTPVHGREKKVKDLLIAAGVPQALKDAIPVVEAAGRIVWVAGWRIAHEFRVREGKGIWLLRSCFRKPSLV